ncbi:MAG TPA: PLP-dependent transferase [bacterium]|nr:PLP-dependent transferase [bacterium]
MDRTTKTLRTRIDPTGANAIATPLFQSAAFRSDSPFFYSRKANPTVVELERAVATLEGACEAVAVSTGMAAIALATSLLAPGDRLVVHPLLYGCSFRQFHRLERQKGIRVETRDLGVADLALPRDTRMVFLETPTNPFLRTVSIRRVADAARRANREALVVVDNTWATPLFQRPLEHGADLSLHSATKFLSGHSDVMGGLALTDRADLAEALREERFYAGAVIDPHAAWLLRRSLQTLPLRMEAHARTTARMAAWLRAQPQIARVDVPEIDGDQLLGYGGILFAELRADLAERYAEFAAALTLFDTGTGMASVTSMVAQPWSGSHASMTAEEKRAIGLSPALVRLCFGLEKEEDLQADLARAFAAIDASPRARTRTPRRARA